MNDDTRKQTIDILLGQLKLQIDPASITDDRLIEDLGMSSIHLMNLMYDLEQVFGINLDPEEMLTVGTVRELLDVLEVKIAERRSAAVS